ncbi:MAG TPA: peptide deformylase, partial [Fodinibius sp.]|nr:peptide deformylase [Fodinibius sp.]
EYLDRDFDRQRLEAGGWTARVIQHEIDHLDGVLFLDYLSFFKRKLFASKLDKIASGKEEVDYPTVAKKVQAQ